MKEAITEQDIWSFLDKHKLAILSTVNESNLPDAAPIYFVMGEKHDFFFITAKETQKYTDMLKQKEVVLTIVNEDTQETVQVRGIVSEQGDMVQTILQQLAEKLNYGLNFTTTLPALKYTTQEKTIMRIIPYRIRMRKYSEKGIEEKTLTFDK